MAAIQGDIIPTLLSTAEAAEILRIKAQTLRVLRTRGGGPRFTKSGGRVYYSAEEITRYLERRTYASTAEAHEAKRNFEANRAGTVSSRPEG